MLYLDTQVDGKVDFTALSVLPKSAANGRSNDALLRIPVAGSRDWLSSMVEVGKQEVRTAAVDTRAHKDTLTQRGWINSGIRNEA